MGAQRVNATPAAGGPGSGAGKSCHNFGLYGLYEFFPLGDFF
jgi:hypothetical protein